jgi:hypothetical protein
MITNLTQVELELLKPHTHARKDCAVGDKIKVDPDTSKWLIEIGVGKLVKAESQDDSEMPFKRSTEKSSGKGE